MKLVDLVLLKEGSMQARELADRNSLQQLQAMYDELMRDMEQEAEPEGGPIADQYADQMQDIEDAMQIKRGGSGEMTYGDMLHKNYPDKYGPGGVALDKDTFTKSSNFDRINEITLKKGDVIKFKNGGRIHIIGPKGDGYDYQDGSEKGHHPKKWFDMMISTGKAMVVKEGTCGYGPNGVPGKTPGGTRGMSGDDRTRTMLKMLIKKEIAKLS